jgi:CRISPR/Cas system-associated endonuclease Cas1
LIDSNLLQEFEKDEAPLFDTLASELAAAREAARVAELKGQEGAVEAKEWSHIRLNANKELAAAKEAMDKAEAVLVSRLTVSFMFM